LAPPDLEAQARDRYLIPTMIERFPVRDVRLDLDDSVPKHWHAAGRAVSTFFDNLSLFFPAGERFFVSAVNHHKAAVLDPALRAQVQDFCGQEGLHSREHARYNRMLQAQGYPAARLEARVERVIAFFGRVVPRRRQLAATCALEHFTASLAHGVLSDPRVLDGAQPVMASLWRWHAVEENEHKGVAYDVYLCAGGTFFERATSMVLTTLVFWALVFDQQLRMMRADGTLWSPREWGRLLWFCWGRPGMLRRMIGHYVSYFRPRFHPWQLDNRDLIERWARDYDQAVVSAAGKISA